MIPYLHIGESFGLTPQTKVGWLSGSTTKDLLFIHGGPMLPDVVKTFGLTPMKATEYLLNENGKPISGGKMIFSFYICDAPGPPEVREKPKAVGNFWGFQGHSYLFRVPARTIYWSQGARITPTAEVAFEYIIESDDILEYWGPSNAKSGRTAFTATPWANAH